MAVKIKKISRRTFASVIGLGGLFLALIARAFLGGSHINLARLDLESKKFVGSVMSTPSVHADVSGDSGGDSCGSGPCCGGSGCDGSY